MFRKTKKHKILKEKINKSANTNKIQTIRVVQNV